MSKNRVSRKINATNSISGFIAGSDQNSLDDVCNELEWIYKNSSEPKASELSTKVESVGEG